MGTTKCKIPLGMFYGHSAILPNDIQIGGVEALQDIPVLSPANTPVNVKSKKIRIRFDHYGN